MLRVLEASGSSSDPYSLHARGYRLDTVEDDEAMTSSLQLPNARGASCIIIRCLSCTISTSIHLIACFFRSSSEKLSMFCSTGHARGPYAACHSPGGRITV